MERPTSHLLFQAHDDLDGLLQDYKLGLGLVAPHVDLNHPAQLSESLVNVAHAHPLPSVVGSAPLRRTRLLRPRWQARVGERGETATADRQQEGVGLTHPTGKPL